MPDVTSTQLARGVRVPGFQAPAPGDPPPPPFLAKFPTVARAAVRIHHRSGAAAARAYLTNVLRSELNHTHASMASNAANTVDGLDHYIAADLADGRSFVDLDKHAVVSMPHGSVRTRIDVVVEDTNQELCGRAIFWDGPNMSLTQAEVAAYPFAVAMQSLYPGRTIRDLAVWQVRRDEIHFVSPQTALGKRGQADMVLAGL